MDNFINEIKTIENKLRVLHGEVLTLAQDSQKRKDKFQAEESKAQSERNADLKEIDIIAGKFDAEISADMDTIKNIHGMIDILIEKKFLKSSFVVPSVQVPASISLEKLNDLFLKINEDTAASAIGKLFKVNGFYSVSEMTEDFIVLATEAELYLRTEVQRLQDAKNAEIIKQKRIAELSEKARRDKLHVLRLNLDKEEENQKVNVVKRRSEFFASELITSFDKRVNAALYDSGYVSGDWNNYNGKRTRNYNLVIGQITIPFKSESVSLKKMLKQALPKYYNGDSFVLPYCRQSQQPLNIYFQHNTNNKKQIAEQIQLILLRLLHNSPVDTFNFYVFDPLSRGANLGVLNAPEAENKTIGISVYTAKEDVELALKELEKTVDNITAQISTYKDYNEYNKHSKTPIKETVVVLFDFPVNFVKEDIDSLRLIVSNASRCGISFIFVSEFSPVEKSNGISLSFCTENKREVIDWSFLSLKNGMIYVDCLKEFNYIESASYKYDYALESMSSQVCGNFVKLYRSKYSEGMAVDNRFSSRISVSATNKYSDATDGIRIPVMVRNSKNGETVDMVLGAENSTHTLITGNTGTGKSTFLHMIISSIIMKYHPDDVELWLLDYGRVEFTTYYENMPPHIRFISLEKESEFTYAFLDYLKKYFSEREKLLMEAGVSDVKGYRKKFGARSMPRIILIVDEFHNMTQHIQQKYEYSNILENALREYRKPGLSCVFSDQTISGLKGLTDSAKMQIKNRIAFSNELQEMKLTLAVSNDNYSQDNMIMKMERTGLGEFWYKEFAGDGSNNFTINQFKGIKIEESEINDIINTAKKVKATIDTNIVKINSNERDGYPVNEVYQHFKGCDIEKRINLYLGSPATIDNLFYLTLENKYKQNILMVGRNSEVSQELMRDIIVNSILSASIRGDIDFIVYADPSDDLFVSLKDNNLLRSKTCSIKIYNNISDICYSINSVVAKIKKNEPLKKKTIIIWLGISDLYDEFDVSAKKSESLFNTNDNSDENIVHVDDISVLLNDPELQQMAKDMGYSVQELLNSMDVKKGNRTATATNDYSYNAIDDMVTLIKKGGKFNVFNFVTVSGSNELRNIRVVDKDSFIHKIILSLPKEEFYEFGIKPREIELEEGQSALYTDGLEYKKFRPYKVENI